MSAAIGPVVLQALAIAVGAVGGAWLRWGLATLGNRAGATLPWGTLAANLIGGFLIGVTVGILARTPGLDPLWRLLFITGFLGALTTFSSFSIEVVTLLQSGDLAKALMLAALHLLGSLAATGLGLYVVRG